MSMADDVMVVVPVVILVILLYVQIKSTPPLKLNEVQALWDKQLQFAGTRDRRCCHFNIPRRHSHY